MVKLRTNVETTTFPVSFSRETSCEGGIFVEGDILYYNGTILDEAFKMESPTGRLKARYQYGINDGLETEGDSPL